MVGRGLERSAGREVRGGTGEVIGGLVFAAAATAGIALVGWPAGGTAGVRRDRFRRDASGVGWGGARGLDGGRGAGVAGIAGNNAPGVGAAVRRALLAYEVVLVVQISVEMVFSGVFSPDIVVLTGMVFTGYRLRQLYAARRRFVSVEVQSALGRAAVRLCLSLGLVFWSANLAFLVFVALPRVIRLG